MNVRRIQSTVQNAIKESHDWQVHVDRQEAETALLQMKLSAQIVAQITTDQ